MQLTDQTTKDLKFILETLDQRLFEIPGDNHKTNASAERRRLEVLRGAVLETIAG